jgi:hypothetical protein
LDKFTPTAPNLQNDPRTGMWAFLKEHAVHWAPPLLALVTVGLGRLTDYKIPLLRGEAPITQLIIEKLALRAPGQAAAFAKLSHVEKQAARMPGISVKIVNDLNNFVRFSELFGIYVIYRSWSRKEEKRFELVDAMDRLNKLEYKKPTDEELRQENDSLKAQIEFLESPGAAEKLAATAPRAAINLTTLQHDGSAKALTNKALDKRV